MTETSFAARARREQAAEPSPVDGKAQALRLWLRMLACTNLMEAELRRRLRARFDCTLPRFDLLAQLDKAPDGLTLGELSRRMMVSNGNVTGLVERLAGDGLIERRASNRDRRSATVRLTDRGRAAFRDMAAEHRDWVADLFAALDGDDVEDFADLLARTKASILSGQARDNEEGRTQ